MIKDNYGTFILVNAMDMPKSIAICRFPWLQSFSENNRLSLLIGTFVEDILQPFLVVKLEYVCNVILKAIPQIALNRAHGRFEFWTDIRAEAHVIRKCASVKGRYFPYI